MLLGFKWLFMWTSIADNSSWTLIFKYLYFFKIGLNYFKSNPRVQACLPLFNQGKVLAVAVTVYVQLLIPEFTVTHLLPCLLIIPLCGQWKVQLSEPGYWLCFSVGYYSTWLWIRLSIHSCGAIPQDLCGTLRCQIGSTFTKFSLSLSSVCYCTSSIVGSRVCGYPLATLCTHYPIVWTVKS